MSNDKSEATFGERPAPSYRIYPVTSHESPDGEQWYECALCGRLAPDAIREHGFEHVVEDAST